MTPSSNVEHRPDIERMLAAPAIGRDPGFAELVRVLPFTGNKLKALIESTLDASRRCEIAPSLLWGHEKVQAVLAHPTLSPLDRYKRLSRQLLAWKEGVGIDGLAPDILRIRFGAEARRVLSPDVLAPVRILVNPQVLDSPHTQDILARFSAVPVEVSVDAEALARDLPLTQGKKTWVLTQHRGRTLKPCPGLKDRYLCCNYFTFDLVSHCPLECSYCILQSYLKDKPAIHVYTNVDEILAGVGEALAREPERIFRVGTGEVADSLALDPLLRFNRHLIAFFAGRPNAVLELKTKSAYVDHLLDLDHRGRTVIAWSMNAPEVIASEEFRTAAFDERLAAAKRAIGAGYKVAFHFDPIIIDLEREEDAIALYERAIDRLKASIDPDGVAWISLGGLRYPKALKEAAEARMPQTKIFTGAFVREGQKFHYPLEVRIRVFKRLWARLEGFTRKEQRYLCMEGKSVWNAVDPSAGSNQALETRLIQPFATGSL